MYVADSGNEAASASERHPVVSVPLASHRKHSISLLMFTLYCS